MARDGREGRSNREVRRPDEQLLDGLGAGWRGAAISREPDLWTFQLTAAHLDEIAAALAQIADAPFGQITTETFPLPTVAPLARSWARELRHGRGFVLLRGLPTERWSDDESRRVLLGLGQHLGRLEKQNRAGELVADVRAERRAGDPTARRYETAQETPFHTDGSDFIALFCLRQGRSGGESRIVSSVAVIDEVRRRRPDLVPLLFEPWHFAMTTDATSTFQLPLVQRVQPFELFYIRWYIEQAQGVPGTPLLSDDRVALLDVIDDVCWDPSMYLDIDFRPGDVQLLSNRTAMHARTTFEDWEELERRRHLLRLWLAAPEDL